MQGTEKPTDKPLVRGITPGGFRISGQIYDRPILLCGSQIYDWVDAQLHEAGTLLGLGQLSPPPELVLIGTGAHMHPAGPALVKAMKAAGMAVDYMDSRSAARTYNILVLEGRAVAVALLPPDC